MNDSEVMKSLQVAFEYTYLHDDWVNPLSEALKEVSVEEGLWKPTASGTSIWQIVLHVAKWNENIVERINGTKNQHPDEDTHWPEIAEEPGQVEWERAQSRLDQSLSSVSEMLMTTSLEKIQASPYGLPDLLCRFTHIGYHLGQITKIREFYAECLPYKSPS